MLKKLLLVLLLSIPFASFGQQHVLFRDSTTIDSFRLTMWVRQLIPPAVPKINPFFDSVGSAYLAPNGVWWRHNGIVWQALTTDPDSAVWATRYYVDSGLSSISAGAVDTNNYISSIARLNREIDSVSNIIDSNNTIIYGSLSDLYDTKADKDTLGNFVLKTYLDSTLGYYVDTAQLNDSLQAVKARGVPYEGATGNVDIGTHTFTAKDGVFNHSSGSGVALSVTKGGSGEALTVNKTSGSGNAMSVTGGVTQLSELHTTTPIADAYIASAATWNAKGTVNSVATGYGLSGGTITTTGTLIADSTLLATKLLVKKQIDSVAALSGGGGGGSPVLGTPYQLLFPTGTDTLKTTDKAYIDTTDNRLVFANDTTTTAVSTDPNGGTKVFGSNRMGMAALRLLDTVSIPAALQRAINAQTVGTIFPLGGTVAYTGMFQQATSGMFQVQVATNVAYGGTYDAVNQQQNYTKVLYSTSTAANNVFFLRTVSLTVGAGIMVGATANSGGSGRGTFTFALPSYNSGQRIFIGYSTSLTQIISTADPSAAASIAMLALAKDAGDATLSWLYNDGSGTPIKVSTGITPNQNDVYRLTVYVSPKGRCYMQLEVMNKTNNTVLVVNPTTDIPAGVKIVPQINVSNASTGAVCTYGLIQFIEEIY